MLNFLSFLVLLYVSGHFQQKKISKYFRLIENFWPVINSCCLFWTWKFYKCFSKIGGKFKFFQKCWISWVFWFYFMFQDISSKKNFSKFFRLIEKFWPVIWYAVIFLSPREKLHDLVINFSISLKNFEKKNFCLKCPET